MPYCTLADITQLISETELAALTDDLSGGVIDPAVVAAAIARADKVIDSALGVRYLVPFTTVPEAVVGISAGLALWELFSRRATVSDPPKAVETRRADAVAMLNNLARGLYALPGADPATAASSDSVGGTAMFSGPDRLFNRKGLRDC